MKLDDLATRALQKLGILAAGEPASAADLMKAKEKLRAAHAAVVARNLSRWTARNVPESVHEPYVALAAVLLAPEFGVPAGADWWGWAMAEIATVASTAVAQGPIPAEYF